MDKTSEAIFSLQPVTFRYKKALDPQALPQFGLVAEQVAKVIPTWWPAMQRASLSLSATTR